MEVDNRTGRPIGDHGTALDAINWLLDVADPYDDNSEFLHCWREGDLGDWPDYYKWLNSKENKS